MWIPPVAELRYSVYPWIPDLPHCCTLDIWAPKTCNPTPVAGADLTHRHTHYGSAGTWIPDLPCCCTLDKACNPTQIAGTDLLTHKHALWISW